VARPDELTEERHRAIAKAVRNGHSRRAAALAAGINERTLGKWMARGKKAQGLSPVPTPERKFVRFYRAIKKADGVAMCRVMRRITSAMPKSWQAAAWWLQHHHRDLYGDDGKLDQALALLHKLDRQAGHDHGQGPPQTGPAAPEATDTCGPGKGI
jgi:transposase-like protein